MSRLYRIEHKTDYTYEGGDVTDSYGLTHMRPRDMEHQTCLAHEARISPEPADQYSIDDVQGNAATYFHVTTPHRELHVSGVSVVEVRDPHYRQEALAQPWEQCRPMTSDHEDAWQAVDFTLESELIDITPEVAEYAAVSFPPGRPIGEAVDDLNHRIYTDFEYNKDATTVTTRVPDVLVKRAGVCQDFAQLFIACLRSQGLAERYVSGYLATVPPPGKPRLVGADATHAWVACWVPGAGWLAEDPTNDKRCDDAHATVAWGRDYRDVPPVRGIIYTESTSSSMSVSVDMAPLSEYAPATLSAES